MLEALGVCLQCRLAHIIRQVAGGHGDALLRPRVYDQPRLTRLLHLRQEGDHAVDRTVGVHTHDLMEHVHGRQRAAAEARAGVVHEEVAGAAVSEDAVPQGLKGGGVRDINGHRLDLLLSGLGCAPHCVPRLKVLRLIDVREPDVHPPGRAHHRCGPSDAGAGTGYNGGISFFKVLGDVAHRSEGPPDSARRRVVPRPVA
mmetsp:Transcript_13781/g.39680  ORF Transcript_13781/g.39680 Transcript_13781/m.39680 type:complete len:200 (-) Transcript_13781:10-609(-)